jgi:hypothetical protein
LGAVPALAAVTVRLTTDGNGDIELARDLRVTLRSKPNFFAGIRLGARAMNRELNRRGA